MNTYFIKGLRDRDGDPIQHGVYKLQELAGRISAIRGELQIIHGIKNKTCNTWDLSHCIYSDAHIWVNRIPKIISYQIGNKVLSAIDALKLVGANATQINEIKALAAIKIINIVQDSEKINTSLNVHPFSWNKTWCRPEILLINLISDFIQFLEEILLAIKQRGLLGSR
jgi:hypothetical protein